MGCYEKEKKRPDYKEAVEADHAEIRKGNYNFEGIGLKETLVEELRNKKSRDNRDLLNRAADRIEELERELREVTPPCKEGDKVYQTDGVRIYESKIIRIIYDTGFIAFDKRALGASIFLSEEAVRQVLAEGREG